MKETKKNLIGRRSMDQVELVTAGREEESVDAASAITLSILFSLSQKMHASKIALIWNFFQNKTHYDFF